MRSPVLLLAAALLAPGAAAQTRTEPFDTGWSFTRRPVSVDAASRASFDDSAWEAVRIPHDWAIAGPFDPSAHGSTGKLPWQGEGWYRKVVELSEQDAGRRVYIDFDGVMAFATVYVNGREAGRWDYGYSPFRIDATDEVRWGGPNVILVHVDTRRWGSRWYPGAGIYRRVRLTIAEPVHIGEWGPRIWTDGDEKTGRRPQTAFVETTFENHREGPTTVILESKLFAPDGSHLTTLPRGVQVPARGRTTIVQEFHVAGPLLWDTEHPNLYTVRTAIFGDGGRLDERETRFGFRTFAFTADDGFHLNGRRVQLKGVNLHHDLGPLGAAFNLAAARRQLRIMQEMGVNALRTSHNPPAREMIELCDEMGILVWDELFDKWERTAGRPDLEPPLPGFGYRHIGNTVQRDRNSPSVVVWSVGNEVGYGDDVDGVDPVRVSLLAGLVRTFDPTRPVAMGMHLPGLVDGKNFAALDLMGWNYARRYDRYHEVWQDRPVVYSESASALSTRGYYEPDLAMRPTDYPVTGRVSSYDLSAAAWSDIPDHEFRLMESDRFVAGEFVWTGFDYLGEPTPFDEQARSSYFGVADLCGFPKDRYWLYRSHWRPDQTTVHILPHWNWPERVGRVVPVFVYTNGDAAELFLNGRSQGFRRKGEVPARPLDLVGPRSMVTASSGAESAALATGGDPGTGWRAAGMGWWQVDLGDTTHVAWIAVDTPLKENLYAYTLAGSLDGATWNPLAVKSAARFPLWEGPNRVFHEVGAEARYLRVTFSEARDGAPVGLNTVSAYAGRIEDDYYDATYDYRLRWNDVIYEPGELRAVAYRNGRPIGEATVQTTGPAESLRLSAERASVLADGEDLVFVTVEAVDGQGLANPLADSPVRFSVTGPGTLEAVCNGDPLSMESHRGARQRLFYGRALVVLRPAYGRPGTIELTAQAEGLPAARLSITTRR